MSYLEPRWRDARLASRRALPESVRPWLLDEASLTKRLKSVCDLGFSVRLESLLWDSPTPGERQLLGLRRGSTALIREVHLLCGATPWVFARTVIPASTLTGSRRRLRHLGTRPLGAFLFADPGLLRDRMQLARIEAGDNGYRTATAGLARKPRCIWGRRSRFQLRGKPLLVNEIFLPSIPAFANALNPAHGSGYCD